jgi:O-antigen/teichoic acid export membrane protein
MANTLLTTGAGFVFWVVAARFYSDADVGLAASVISAIFLLGAFSRMGLDYALIRFLPKAERPVDLVNTGFSLSGVVALAMAAIFIAGLALWSPALMFIREHVGLSVGLALFVLFSTLMELMDSVFIANRRAEFVLWKNAILSAIRIPLPIALVSLLHGFGIVTAWGIAALVALASSFCLFLRRVQQRYRPAPRLDLGTIKLVWRYSAGNYAADLLNAAPGLVLPIIVVNVVGAEPNAYFYVAWMMAGLLFAIPRAVSMSLFAEGSHFETRLWRNVVRSLRFTFLLLVPGVVILFLAGKWGLLLFGASYAANGLKLLWVLGVSSVFLGINEAYYSILRVEGRIRELVVVLAFVAAATLAGSYFIIPGAGIIGIGYAWLAAQGAVAIYALIRMMPSLRPGKP